MKDLYPLKFTPIFKDKIWGADKIHSILGKDYPTLPNCGETWEISDVNGQQTIVSNGPLAGKTIRQLTAQYKCALVGENVFERYGESFPLLFKFISADDDLSIQVHPDDDMAALENSRGKTEMWYVVDADEGSELIFGFEKPTSREEYLQAFDGKYLENILHRIRVQNGDCFFIKPGIVHSIGRGILLAEIQQSSDLTYRIYDFDRLDDKGNPRELHVEKALQAIDFENTDTSKINYTLKNDAASPLASCNYFTTNIIDLKNNSVRDYSKVDSFVVYMCVEGAFSIIVDGEKTDVALGECILLPACIDRVKLETEGSCRILETFV